MEEQALYRAILDAPHDDTPRLVYADWLDENADRLPEPLARQERARAEFIRLQCKLSRSVPGGWKAAQPPGVSVPEAEANREKRLRFTQGPKWRREFPVWLASSPFDRGFLRPFRSLRPVELLDRGLRAIDDQVLSLCPLWDIHLYASQWHHDPNADRGQYADLLAEVGQSRAMERVGWLKVSFFQTPTVEFLRTGNFPNVETLVLNCGPFPEVLEAVAANESFRSLRYVRFGPDRWAWDGDGDTAADLRFASLMVRLEDANIKHLPYGEMRTVLRKIVADPSAMTLPEPEPPRPALPHSAHSPALVAGPSGLLCAATGREQAFAWYVMFVGVWVVGMMIALGWPVPSPTSGPSMPAFDSPNLKGIDPYVFNAAERLNMIHRGPPEKSDGQPKLDPNFVGPPWPPPEKKQP